MNKNCHVQKRSEILGINIHINVSYIIVTGCITNFCRIVNPRLKYWGRIRLLVAACCRRCSHAGRGRSSMKLLPYEVGMWAWDDTVLAGEEYEYESAESFRNLAYVCSGADDRLKSGFPCCGGAIFHDRG